MPLTEPQMTHLKRRLEWLKPSLAGRFFYYCIPFRKKVVLRNMQQVFAGALSEADIQKLAQCFYSHVAKSLKENLIMRFLTLKQIKAKAVVKGEEHLWKLADNDIKGAIIITAHFGNWEFAPIAGILNFPEWQGRFYFVRKLIGTKWIEKILFRRYYQAGLNVIPKTNSLEKICDVLEKHNAVVFVMDQHASIKAKDGIKVEFFGKMAGTFRSPATIVRYTQVPVLAARSYRDSNGIHVLEFLPRIPWIHHEDAKQELYLNTRRYNQIIEQCILEYPEQWLWMHKRWKDT